MIITIVITLLRLHGFLFADQFKTSHDVFPYINNTVNNVNGWPVRIHYF